MKVELLYSDGCPNWRQALEELTEVLRGKGIDEEVQLVRVGSDEEARRLGFPGSPTIRIDGEDVDPDSSTDEVTLENRIYWVEERATGRPPKEWIDAAIEAALG